MSENAIRTLLSIQHFFSVFFFLIKIKYPENVQKKRKDVVSFVIAYSTITSLSNHTQIMIIKSVLVQLIIKKH